MKLCIKCGTNPATVPDRNNPGRPIKRLCSACHGERLRGDIRVVLRRMGTWCRCAGRGFWHEQIDGPNNLRRVDCPNGCQPKENYDIT